MLFQITQDRPGDVDRLEFQRAGILDVARLCENLEYGRFEPPAGGFAPHGHFGITPPAVLEVIVPQLCRKGGSIEFVLVTHDQIEEIAKEGAVLDRRRQASVRGHVEALERALTVARGEAEALRQRLVGAEEEAKALRTSTSWRITAPLRAVMKGLRGWRGALAVEAEDAAPDVRADTEPCGRAIAREPTSDWQGGRGSAFGQGEAAWRLRVGLRRSCREALGVPDAARLVVGKARDDAARALVDFARAAESVGAVRNGVVFVWLGGGEQAWADGLGEMVRLSIAERRVFVRDAVEFERWMLAGDIYVACRCSGEGDPSAVEARARGLPVVSLDPLGESGEETGQASSDFAAILRVLDTLAKHDVERGA